MIIWPWKIEARYADDYEFTACGYSEEDCMEKIAAACAEHGECEWYSGVTDEDYVWGEYIGRENFIYD